MATRRKEAGKAKAQKPKKTPKPAVSQVGVSRESQIASGVWLEIGPIWLERNPVDDVIIRESPARLIKQSR
jgi:hypothetical protein